MKFNLIGYFSFRKSLRARMISIYDVDIMDVARILLQRAADGSGSSKNLVAATGTDGGGSKVGAAVSGDGDKNLVGAATTAVMMA